MNHEHGKYCVVAIDGPAGAGKSTVARILAHQIGFQYVDTGAIYRCIALLAQRRGYLPVDFRQGSAEDKRIQAGELDPQLKGILGDLRSQKGIEFSWEGDQFRVHLNTEDVSQKIRQEAISQAASSLSSRPVVRAALLDFQRDFAQRGNVVLEGRDIGTVVFPQAQVKIFLTAKAEVRARRRYEELMAKGERADFAAMVSAIEERDRQDRQRSLAPLVAAADAHEVDSSDLSIEEVLKRVMTYIPRTVLPSS